jgi:hypothetical protein
MTVFVTLVVDYLKSLDEQYFADLPEDESGLRAPQVLEDWM